MKNFDLNAGGLIGGIAFGGIATAVIFLTFSTQSHGRSPYRLIIIALLGGAVAGNFLWGKVFKKSE